jgi:hypothetical protein
MTLLENVPQTYLGKLEFILNQVGLPAYLSPKDAEIPFDYLLVALDEDLTQPPKHLLKLLFIEEVLNTPGEQGEKIEQPERMGRFSQLQFYLELPIKVPATKLLDTYRLVSAFSSLMPNGALVLNEAEKNTVVYYSHTLMSRPETVDIGVVVEIIDQTRFFLPRFLPQLFTFVSTPKPLKVILAETQKLMVEATQPNLKV